VVTPTESSMSTMIGFWSCSISAPVPKHTGLRSRSKRQTSSPFGRGSFSVSRCSARSRRPSKPPGCRSSAWRARAMPRGGACEWRDSGRAPPH
jgi:hypothetical protein